MSNISDMEAWRRRSKYLQDAPLEAEPELPLKHGRGGGKSGDMDAVDAKIAAAEARTDTKFAELRGDLAVQFGEIKAELARKPGTGTLIGVAVAIVSIILAAVAFGGDRFDAGIGMADVQRAQIDRDTKQDAAVKDINAKLDKLLAK